MNIILYSIICFFALYGILELILNIIHYNPNIKDNKNILSQPYAILCVENQEDCIESIVRSIAWQMTIQNGSAHYINELIVVDLGSSDKTLDILKLLAIEYNFVSVMNKNEYLSFISAL